ncbi:TonB-dependent receptor [Leptobacterium flavescens]|uniref:TonB-dependent receptor n=1 Tax=Leptobacterium flavescens TaxID=472055 RepID=A0A6P0UKI3_9FLAO|nr:TonB-dependent receptor [Leptobacterium flavescens]NER13805.1 TonB-dependent receptor [Leptobacterium flavescens]
MKSYLMIILLLFGISETFSQQCEANLKGEIIDFHDGTPLVGATVILLKDGTPSKSVITDLEGKFSIKNICIGTYEIEVSHPECKSKIVPVEIEGNTFKKVRLEHHLEKLGEVVVTGDNGRQVAETVNSQSLKAAELVQFSDATLGDALREISGVSSLNTGSTIVKPIIQGLNSSRILIITNNVRLQDQEWGIEHAPNVDLNTADRLTVVKGSGALQYGGDAIGGIVLAKPRRLANHDTIFGKTILSASSNGRGGSITSSLDKGFDNGLGVRVQGTYKKFGDFRAPDYFLTNTGTEQKSFSVNLGINKFQYGAELFYSYFDTAIGILRAADFGNITDLVRAINSPVPAFTDDFSYTINPPRQEVSHHLLKASAFVRLERFGKISLQYAFQFNDRQEFDNRRGEDDGIPIVDLELTTHNLDLVVETHPTKDLEVTAGVSAIYQENFADPLTGVRRVIPDYEKYGIGVFGGLAFNFNESLLLDLGARVDYTNIDAEKFYRTSFFESRGYDVDFADIVVQDFGTQLLTNPQFDYTNLSATVGLNYKIKEDLELLFNYGLASRPPNPSELFSEGLNQSSAAFELGDLRIDTEISNKLSFSFQGRALDKRLNFNLTPYANFISDFIVLEPTGVLATSRGTFQVFEYLQNDATLYGVDVDATYDLNEQFSFKTSFSYLRGQDTERDQPIINIPQTNWFNTLSYKNEKWKNLQLSLKSEAFFRQNRFPDNNFIAQVVENNEFVDVLVDVSTPPPGYHLLHFDSSVQFKFGGTDMELGFSVENIFNTNYRQYLNRFRLFADDLGRNFTLRLKFNY